MKWVAVEDTLPDDLESVLLLYYDLHGKEVISGHWDEENEMFVQTALGFLPPCSCMDFMYHKKGLITHWMPLPALPHETDNQERSE